MSTALSLLCLLWLCLLGGSTSPTRSEPAASDATPATPEPSKPQPAADLTFQDMFIRPIGPRGAAYTPKLFELAGKRVRLQGFMVRRATYTPGRCILTQAPTTLHEREMGLADDLPITATWVDMPGGRGGLGHIGGLIEITGVLSLGPRQESDGRVSHVRIAADVIAPVARPHSENPKVEQPKAGS